MGFAAHARWESGPLPDRGPQSEAKDKITFLDCKLFDSEPGLFHFGGSQEEEDLQGEQAEFIGTDICDREKYQPGCTPSKELAGHHAELFNGESNVSACIPRSHTA